MKTKTWQFVLLGLLVLVIAGGGIAYMTSGSGKSKNVTDVVVNTQQSMGVKKKAPAPAPNPSVDNRTPSVYTEDGQEGSPEEIARTIDMVHRTRSNPTSESVQALISLLEKNKNNVVLGEAIDALGAIALQGAYSDLAFKVLSEKAMDKNFTLRSQALLTAATVGKDQALPLVTALLEDPGTGSIGDSNKQEVLTRALNLIGSTSCIPLLTKVIGETSDHSTRNNAYGALARIGTPDALSFLQQQVQATSGADQVASASALARSDSPELRQWIAGAIQDGTLGKDAVKALSVSPAAPDIFGNALLKDGLDPAQKIDVLKQIGSVAIGGPEREQLAVAIAPLLDSGGELQKEAIKLMGQLGGKGASDILYPYLYSDDPAVRAQTFSSYIGFATPSNYQYLFDFIGDSDQQTRRMAMSMIERFYGESDRAALEQAAQSSDPYIRQKADQFRSRLK